MVHRSEAFARSGIFRDFGTLIADSSVMDALDSKLYQHDPNRRIWNWAIGPRDLIASRNNRLAYIDVARGWMICLVVIAHCFGQASLAESSWLWNLNPTGWATKVFVMLTGFSALVILRADRPENARRIYRRAAQVMAIAWVSNLLSIMLTRASFSAVVDSLSWKLPWTISQFLIPTSMILALSPSVAGWCRRLGAGRVGCISMVAWFASDFVGWWWADRLTGLGEVLLLGNQIITIPLLHYVLAGVTVQALAAWLMGFAQSHPNLLGRFTLSAWMTAMIVLFGDALWADWIGVVDHWLNPAVALCRFVVFVLLSLWICRAVERGSGAAMVVSDFLSPVGKSALLIFIAHRPVVHAVGAVVSDWDRFQLAKLVMMIVWVFVILQLGLWIRSQFPSLSRRMSAIGL